MDRTKALLLGVIIVLVAVYYDERSNAEHPHTIYDEAAIDHLVERAQIAFNVPGISVGIVKDGQLVFSKGYGLRSVDTGEAMTPDTVFGIASHTKAYTVGALGILVDEGILTWDDPVQKWIPEFELYDPWVSEHFTIRDLLSHRSGLPLGAGDLMWWPNPTFTRQEVIMGLRHLKPTSEFRTKYDYDNLLYIVAGEIVTRASGVLWEDFIETRIFDPLDMGSCKTGRDRLPPGTPEAAPHAIIDGKSVTTFYHEREPASSAASIQCSVPDHAKWVIAHLREGKMPNGDYLFSPEVHKDMWTPQTIKGVSDFARNNMKMHFNNYGLGWNLFDQQGYLIVSHSGGLQGMVTLTTLIPELNTAIIVFTNTMSGSAMRAITNQLVDNFAGVAEPLDWVALGEKQQADDQMEADAIIAAAQNARPAVINPPRANSEIAGTYRDAWYGDIMVSMVDDELLIQFSRTPRLHGKLEHFDGDTYIVRWDDVALGADAYMRFSSDDNGNIAGATMEAVSPLTDFSFDFHDLDLVRQN